MGVSQFEVLPELKETEKGTLKIEVELPAKYKPYFEYLNLNFNLDIKEYLKSVIRTEIESINRELQIF